MDQLDIHAIAATVPAEMNIYISAAIIIGAAYLLGSIPFGLMITRLAGLGDIRKIGSGNIGATNVLRTGKTWLAILTLVCDMGKAFIAVKLASWWVNSYSVNVKATNVAEATNNMIADTNLISCATIAVLIGHMFPAWLNFRGGKGIACVFGVAFALFMKLGIFCAAVWVGVFIASRISSAAGLAMVASFGGLLYYYVPLMWVPALVIPLLVTLKHHENIRRLLTGSEHQFEFEEKASDSKEVAIAEPNTPPAKQDDDAA